MISAMTAYYNTDSKCKQADGSRIEEQGTYFEVSQGDTVLGIMSLAQKKVPEAELASIHLEFFDDRDNRLPPCCIIRELSPGQPLGRSDLLL